METYMAIINIAHQIGMSPSSIFFIILELIVVESFKKLVEFFVLNHARYCDNVIVTPNVKFRYELTTQIISEELNIVKSGMTTFYIFTPCIFLQVPSKR